MASTDARVIPWKNGAYRWTFDLRNASSRALVSGDSANFTEEVSKDGAAFAACTNNAVEIGSTGVYYLDLTSGEMNADTVVVKITSSTGTVESVVGVFYPEEAGDVRVNMTQLNSSSTAANLASYFYDSILATSVIVGTSTTEFTGSTPLSNTVDDLYNHMYCVFITGALAGQNRQVSDYVASTRTLKFLGAAGAADAEWPVAPTAADAFVLIGRSP